MKNRIIKLLVALFAIAVVVNIVHDFILNDTSHYFSAQPQRLFVVAAIAIVGGLASMLFDRLSPRLKRRAELLTLGLILAVLVYFAGCFIFLFARFPSEILNSDLRRTLIGVIVCSIGAIAILCFSFHRVFKRSIK